MQPKSLTSRACSDESWLPFFAESACGALLVRLFAGILRSVDAHYTWNRGAEIEGSAVIPGDQHHFSFLHSSLGSFL